MYDSFRFTCVPSCGVSQINRTYGSMRERPKIDVQLSRRFSPEDNKGQRNAILWHLMTCTKVLPYINRWAADMYEKQPKWLEDQP